MDHAVWLQTQTWLKAAPEFLSLPCVGFSVCLDLGDGVCKLSLAWAAWVFPPSASPKHNIQDGFDGNIHHEWMTGDIVSSRQKEISGSGPIFREYLCILYHICQNKHQKLGVLLQGPHLSIAEVSLGCRICLLLFNPALLPQLGSDGWSCSPHSATGLLSAVGALAVGQLYKSKHASPASPSMLLPSALMLPCGPQLWMGWCLYPLFLLQLLLVQHMGSESSYRPRFSLEWIKVRTEELWTTSWSLHIDRPEKKLSVHAVSITVLQPRGCVSPGHSDISIWCLKYGWWIVSGAWDLVLETLWEIKVGRDSDKLFPLFNSGKLCTS